MGETEGLRELLLLMDEQVVGEDEIDKVPLGHCDVEGEPEEEALEDKDAVTHAVPLALGVCDREPVEHGEGVRVLHALAVLLREAEEDGQPVLVWLAVGLCMVVKLALRDPEGEEV